MWLFLLATMDPRTETVDIRQFRRFAKALGLNMAAPGATIRSTIARTLDTLVEAKLVRVTTRGHQQFVVQLRSLDGRDRQYEMPDGHAEKFIVIPGELFAQGWHAELSPIELAALLISLTESSWQFRAESVGQWQKTRAQIHKKYGISESTWSRGAEGLYRRGLLEWGPSVPLRPMADTVEAVLEDEDIVVDQVPASRYLVHSEVLSQDPGVAPRFRAVTVPVYVKVESSRKSMRLHERLRFREAEPESSGVEGVPASSGTNTVGER
jgi:hypothetical protein